MRILVTGASGFAGSHLIDLLVRQSPGIIFASTRSQVKGDDSKVWWLQCDLRKSSSVDEVVNLAKPDVIYHLAAYPSPQKSFKYPIRALNETAGMHINLMEACLKAGMAPLVLLSGSGQVYGRPDKLPIDEQAKIDCPTPYAVAKFSQETIAGYYQNRGIRTIIARAFNHTGPRQSTDFLVANLAYQVVRAEASAGQIKEIKVGDLSSKRDFTDVRDVVKAYAKLVAKGQLGEVYNVCSGRSVSGQEILEKLISQAGVKIVVKFDKSKARPSDNAELRGDHSKLTSATNWMPTIALDKTLEDTLNYWRRVVGGQRA